MKSTTHVITTLIVVLTAHAAFAQEFTTQAAKEARAAYEADLQAAKEKYKQSLTEAAVKAVEAGELEEVVRIKEAKEELEGKVEDGETDRELWIKDGDAGFFERLNTKRHWVERVNNDRALIYMESDRTDEYVELSINTPPFPERIIRLYDDHFKMRNKRSEPIKRIRGGKWAE